MMAQQLPNSALLRISGHLQFANTLLEVYKQSTMRQRFFRDMFFIANTAVNVLTYARDLVYVHYIRPPHPTLVLLAYARLLTIAHRL
jgi:hypothetical protein